MNVSIIYILDIYHKLKIEWQLLSEIPWVWCFSLQIEMRIQVGMQYQGILLPLLYPRLI